MMGKSISVVLTLHDDESTREKLTILDQWEALMDDARNEAESNALHDGVCALMRPGHSYRVTVEELDDGES